MRQILILTAIAAATFTAACETTVTCEGDNCSNQGGNSPTGGSAPTGGSSNTGGSNAGGSSSQGGAAPNLSDFCDKLCACEGCDQEQLHDCYAETADFQSEALSAGCSSQLAAFDGCLDAAQCINGTIDFGCEGQMQSLALCMNDDPPPPTENTCALAAQICGEPNPDPVECEGAVLCTAECIVEFGCDIADQLLVACLDGC